MVHDADDDHFVRHFGPVLVSVMEGSGQADEDDGCQPGESQGHVLDYQGGREQDN